jgi:hypothetical protein
MVMVSKRIWLAGAAFVFLPGAAFAQAQPERVGRLMLCAFTYKGNGAAEIARRREKIDALRASPRRKRDSAMIRSIFTRDGHPESTTRRWSTR